MAIYCIGQQGWGIKKEVDDVITSLHKCVFVHVRETDRQMDSFFPSVIFHFHCSHAVLVA